jgi:SAM-dependent methyltransferase
VWLRPIDPAFRRPRERDIHGTDVRRGAVAWCRRNLRFATFNRNRLTPAVAYDDATFDFVYACSVFTHLPEALQFGWMSELRRILKPHGLLLFTTHGDWYRDQLSADERAAFDVGQLVVRQEQAAGLNMCAAFHPRSWVENDLLDGFEVVDSLPGATTDAISQDLYIVRAN